LKKHFIALGKRDVSQERGKVFEVGITGIVAQYGEICG
jgi:hypothetical protein